MSSASTYLLTLRWVAVDESGCFDGFAVLQKPWLIIFSVERIHVAEAQARVVFLPEVVRVLDAPGIEMTLNESRKISEECLEIVGLCRNLDERLEEVAAWDSRQRQVMAKLCTNLSQSA